MPPSVARFEVEVSGPKPSPWRLRRAVEVLLHDAGLDAHAPRLGVELADRVHVARGVEHEPAAAGRLPGEARAAAARDDRHAEAAGERTAAATSSASRGNATASGSIAYMLASPANRWRV